VIAGGGVNVGLEDRWGSFATSIEGWRVCPEPFRRGRRSVAADFLVLQESMIRAVLPLCTSFETVSRLLKSRLSVRLKLFHRTNPHGEERGNAARLEHGHAETLAVCRQSSFSLVRWIASAFAWKLRRTSR
jgi:hypothetical protein